MTLPFPDLINILKVLSPDALPKRLNPTVLIAWIQERSNIPIDKLDKQYKEGKQELTDKLLELGYSGDVKKLHLNEMWFLLAELEGETAKY